MALLDFNFNPSHRQLRQFGAVCTVALPLATWAWTKDLSAVAWAAGIGALLCGIGYVLPRLLKPIFVGLTIVTIPIGLVVGELAMLLIYFGLFLPMAIVFRMLGRDALDRRTAKPDSTTLWKPRSSPSSIRKYYQQS